MVFGVETEYGFSVEGRGAEHQVEDAQEFVRAYPGECFVGWDYRQESPRRDLRGFTVSHLAQDPVDAQFETAPLSSPHEVRSDRVLPSGARFYNDHGHPEFASPECHSVQELVMHDLAGEDVLRMAANAYQASVKRRVRVYKNNTDYHGASYGTHESYLVPRRLAFDELYSAVMPMLVARQVLTGAGKVGAESGAACDFQISQRADFITESANVETLFRRPLFNTRDEPHGIDRQWIRLHVICGDANMMPQCTARKATLMSLTLRLAEQGKAPKWEVHDPVASFKAVSRDLRGEGRIELKGGNWTTPRNVIESVLNAADEAFDDEESKNGISEAMNLLDWRRGQPDLFRRHVDWAAKHWLLGEYRDMQGLAWKDAAMQALCLEYHSLDEDEGLYFGLLAAEEVAERPLREEIVKRLNGQVEPTRGLVRALAVSRFREYVASMSWSSITWKVGTRQIETKLDPGARFDPALADVESVEQFINCLTKSS